MTVNNYTGKCASGMDKFGSVVDRMYMKLGSKFLSSLRVKTQLLKRLQCVTVADGATHSQRYGVERFGGEVYGTRTRVALSPVLMWEVVFHCLRCSTT